MFHKIKKSLFSGEKCFFWIIPVCGLIAAITSFEAKEANEPSQKHHFWGLLKFFLVDF